MQLLMVHVVYVNFLSVFNKETGQVTVIFLISMGIAPIMQMCKVKEKSKNSLTLQLLTVHITVDV